MAYMFLWVMCDRELGLSMDTPLVWKEELSTWTVCFQLLLYMRVVSVWPSAVVTLCKLYVGSKPWSQGWIPGPAGLGGQVAGVGGWPRCSCSDSGYLSRRLACKTILALLPKTNKMALPGPPPRTRASLTPAPSHCFFLKGMPPPRLPLYAILYYIYIFLHEASVIF